MKSNRVIVAIFLAFFLLPSCQYLGTCTKGFDSEELGAFEEYLIDFSKKVEGYRLQKGSLPPNLDAEKFFSILEEQKTDREMIRKVREYPVRVAVQGESYVLILCDKKSEFMLYKDLGETITFIDHPYWRTGEKVRCNQ
jgi:hypothetical protein